MQQALKQKLPRITQRVRELDEKNIKLSWDDLIALAIGYASENDEQFFEFMQKNYAAVTEKPAVMPYVPPSAIVVSTERTEGFVAAVLGIGIGWVWAWLAVSPWTVDQSAYRPMT